MTGRLPPEFAELECYSEAWCLRTESERWAQRMASPMQELLDFYHAAFPRLEAAIEYCDRYSLDDLPEDCEQLLRLIYSVVLVSMAVEVFGQPKTVDSADAVIHRVTEPLP